MKFVQPEVFLIAKSTVQDAEVAEWLRRLGCSEQTISNYGDTRDSHGLSLKTNGERLIEMAGRRCYLSFQPDLNPNVTRIRADITEYCENILRQSHGSVLEHASFTFAIEGVSRVFTGEMNRHRAGVAVSEGSMRYIRFNDIPCTQTPLLTITDTDKEDDDYKKYERMNMDGNILSLNSVAYKKARTREVFERLFGFAEMCYSDLQCIWYDELKPESTFKWKKHITSLIRRIIPMGVATGGVWTMNIRALRHICAMRCSEAAEEEIALVAGKMLEIMMREEPSLFGDFHLNEKMYWTPKYAKV